MSAPTADGPPTAPGPPDLRSYDIIACSISGGKDSAAALHHTTVACAVAGVLDRVRVIHCDLGEEDWPRVPELAARHAARYGLPFTIVRRDDDSLLAYAQRRGRFPSSSARWCTSSFKRDPSRRLLTAWAREARENGITDRPVRILEVMGFRAAESAARAKRPAFSHNAVASNGRRHVDTWLPIHAFTLQDVQRTHETHQIELHQAYRLGMRRLSCTFCVLAGRDDLVRAAQLRPRLAGAYARVEERTGHSFQQTLPMSQIIDLARQPVLPKPLALFVAAAGPAHWACPTWPPMNAPVHDVPSAARETPCTGHGTEPGPPAY